ncbi:MAG: hypothetical protein RR092_01710, partial [Oscillospiraceae bacterium]
MKKSRALRAALFLALALVLNVTLSLAADPDPLVTLSYLNTTYLPSILTKVDEKIAAQSATPTAAANFTVVSLQKGQTLRGDLGCEVLLRVGTAVCVADSAPGLVDSTDGGSLQNGGGLVKNHLYLMTIENRGV